MPHTRLPRLATGERLEALLQDPLLLLFKHSHLCPTSRAAYWQVCRFRQRHPEAPLSLVHVQRDRELSREVARRTGVRHESPQVVALRGGRVVATASHHAVTCAWLEAVLLGRDEEALVAGAAERLTPS